MLDILPKHVDDIIVLELKGDFDMSACLTFNEIASNFLKDDFNKFILDFKSTPVVTSVGFREIIALFKKCKAMAVCNMPPNVLESFGFLDFKTIFNHYDSQQEALDSISGPA